MTRLRLLSAWELLQARREAERCCDDPAESGLWQNACLIARAAVRGHRRRYPSGAAVLQRCTPEQIEQMTRAYQSMAERMDPHCGQPTERTEKMLEQLRQSPEERIQWKILRTFGVLPTEPRAKRLRRSDYLQCALHLLLDEEERLSRLCPDCRARAEEERCPVCGAQWEESAQFDLRRFQTLKGGDD